MEMFLIEVIYPITDNFNDEEISEISMMRLKASDLEDGYTTDLGYWDLVADPIVQLHPKCFIPKDGKNKRFYTEAVFLSGNLAYPVGKPSQVYKKIADYIKTVSLPTQEK